MLARSLQLFSSLLLLTFTQFISLVLSRPNGADIALDRSTEDNNPHNRDLSGLPSPVDGPPFSAGALRDPKYLPVQIGGIVAAYGLSLVLVAITLLSLAKKRRENLQSGSDEIEHQTSKALFENESPINEFKYNSFLVISPPRALAPDLAHLWPPRFNEEPYRPYAPNPPRSLTLNCNVSGAKPPVHESVVSANHTMAPSHMNEMYKRVKDQEVANKRGISGQTKLAISPRKDRAKPANLELSEVAHCDKPQSKTSSFFASLRSPRKKQFRGLDISSPIMTPQSRTLVRPEAQEMSAIPPRYYAPPPPPPPIPADQIPFGAHVSRQNRAPSPTVSPQSIQTIDQRINPQLRFSEASHARSDINPVSATSERSQTPLVGLPASPKPGAQFPPLPSTPKPDVSFSRANSPSAVRVGGNLPLRAYEPSMSSPTSTFYTTKQTVFERKGPLSPTTGRTPMTAGAVPYSPYQPFTPIVPVTPSLVTREDRKKMKRAMPKTPTLEMVKDTGELW
ncbi:hypothetical protein E4U57_000237 [Claviceps arundinis]|uniref:Uncharacterized protein n=1 Tax=Claviceps arundinis TaxID=1623583 RepID=A0A9P7MSU5_9HYPO|nr:hypothetical protein E4U57_000237 [Claviceps arundinis]KAG5967979.1 hypothetical protein E4U56_000556 [Claviceps arundinis]